MKENDKAEKYECDASFQDAWIATKGVIAMSPETKAEIEEIKKRAIQELLEDE